MIAWNKELYPEMCEGLLQLAVAEYVQWWRCFVVPNLCLFHEMDVAVLTRAGCLWEFEIKVSQRDWDTDNRKDVQGDHWRVRRRLDYVERFYYVIAPGLKPPEWLPEWAGILETHEPWPDHSYIGVKPIRRAKARHAERLTDKHRLAIYTAAHRRFWDRVMRMPTRNAIEALRTEPGGAVA